jgi:hypothetical protein
MKAFFMLSLTVCAIASSCSNETSADEVKVAIPGTYIRASQHEYGNEFDTLVVSLQNEAANEFKINRRWQYERVLDGKAIEPEYKSTTTTAVYDEAAKQLKETETGDTYSFDPATKSLFAGSTKYEKLK